ncbi:MAG: hypothetical protein ACI81V_000015 [Lentimonas sp.]|jgi:hypothetical protein
MKQLLHFIPLCLVCVFTPTMFAQTESAFQDQRRLLGLDIVGPVMQAGSDPASDLFQRNDLAGFNDYIRSNWSAPGALVGLGAISLDPNAIVLNQEANVRAYYVSSSDSGGTRRQRNTLGFNVEDLSTETLSDSQLIFPAVWGKNTYYSDPTSLTKDPRTQWRPLLRGDFVDLGTVGAGDRLNLFLANRPGGTRGNTNYYSSDAAANPDQLNHMVAFAIPDSPFILLGFEDPYSRDSNDFNDNIFAFNIGVSNVNYLANPEPSFWLMMGALCGLGVWLYRRQQGTAASPDLAA